MEKLSDAEVTKHANGDYPTSYNAGMQLAADLLATRAELARETAEADKEHAKLVEMADLYRDARDQLSTVMAERDRLSDSRLVLVKALIDIRKFEEINDRAGGGAWYRAVNALATEFDDIPMITEAPHGGTRDEILTARSALREAIDAVETQYHGQAKIKNKLTMTNARTMYDMRVRDGETQPFEYWLLGELSSCAFQRDEANEKNAALEAQLAYEKSEYDRKSSDLKNLYILTNEKWREAEQDAERLAKQWVVFGANCCSRCAAPVHWKIDDSNPVAEHKPDCPIALHRARIAKGQE